MPTLTIPHSFSANTVAYSAQVNANFNAVATLLNSTKLNSDNIQTGGVAEANIASSAVTAAKIATDAVTTAKIQDAAVTYAKLAAATISSLRLPGEITLYGGSSAPSGWLLCDGSPVSRTTYAALFAIVGTAFGNGSENADGTSSGNGTSSHFNLPDLRGRFPRMVDGTAGRDPDKTSRTAMRAGGATGNSVGSIQDDAFESHTHEIRSSAVGGTPDGSYNNQSQFQYNGATNATGGNETRPKNINLNYIIKV